jgi:hypothetical protein
MSDKPNNIKEFLVASQELLLHQQEVLQLMADSWHIETQDVFYKYMLKREVEQEGKFAEGKWRYFFHGMELDVYHFEDKRFMSIEFGQSGKTNVLTGASLFDYILFARPPWQPFRHLLVFSPEEELAFSDENSKFRGYIPDYNIVNPRFSPKFEELIALGWLEKVGKEISSSSSSEENAKKMLRNMVESSLARGRWTISALGKQVLTENLTNDLEI